MNIILNQRFLVHKWLVLISRCSEAIHLFIQHVYLADSRIKAQSMTNCHKAQLSVSETWLRLCRRVCSCARGNLGAKRVSYYISKGSVAIRICICGGKCTYICKGKSKTQSQIVNWSHLALALTDLLKKSQGCSESGLYLCLWYYLHKEAQDIKE